MPWSGILKEFGPAVVSKNATVRGSLRVSKPDDPSVKSEPAVPDHTDGVVDFIDHLKNPFHDWTVGRVSPPRRAWGHTLAMQSMAA
jgi:hypothetical protein